MSTPISAAYSAYLEAFEVYVKAFKACPETELSKAHIDAFESHVEDFKTRALATTKE